jgi:hypothetical protein
MVMDHTETEIRLLKSQLKRQASGLAQIEKNMAQATSNRRLGRLAGIVVLLASVWWLWMPLNQTFAQGDLSLWAGVGGALVGVTLLLRT